MVRRIHWGRLIYPAFYLVAGAAGSYVPLVGASGAIAALMGAFRIRFPKMKIEMGCFIPLLLPIQDAGLCPASVVGPGRIFLRFGVGREFTGGPLGARLRFSVRHGRCMRCQVLGSRLAAQDRKRDQHAKAAIATNLYFIV